MVGKASYINNQTNGPPPSSAPANKGMLAQKAGLLFYCAANESVTEMLAQQTTASVLYINHIQVCSQDKNRLLFIGQCHIRQSQTIVSDAYQTNSLL